jgi:hypothetical protein
LNIVAPVEPAREQEQHSCVNEGVLKWGEIKHELAHDLIYYEDELGCAILTSLKLVS